MSVEFFTPPGEFVADPEPAWLARLVLDGDATFWNSGAGQGSLSHGDAETKLILTYDEAHGFYLEYVTEDKQYFVSLGEGSFDEVVAPHVGGDPLPLPAAFFVSPLEASRVVEEFLCSGTRGQSIKWGLRSEQGWHYGYPDAE